MRRNGLLIPLGLAGVIVLAGCGTGVAPAAPPGGEAVATAAPGDGTELSTLHLAAGSVAETALAYLAAQEGADATAMEQLPGRMWWWPTVARIEPATACWTDRRWIPWRWPTG